MRDGTALLIWILTACFCIAADGLLLLLKACSALDALENAIFAVLSAFFFILKRYTFAKVIKKTENGYNFHKNLSIFWF